MADKPIRDWAFVLHTNVDDPRTGVIEATSKSEAKRILLSQLKDRVKVKKLELTLR